jgi:hypothetical protein
MRRAGLLISPYRANFFLELTFFESFFFVFLVFFAPFLDLAALPRLDF